MDGDQKIICSRPFEVGHMVVVVIPGLRVNHPGPKYPLHLVLRVEMLVLYAQNLSTINTKIGVSFSQTRIRFLWERHREKRERE